MIKRSVRWWLLLLAAVLVAGTLATAGVAWAQSSGAFDFGCWGVTPATGGVVSSATHQVVNTVGQPGAGEFTSPNVRIRAGYIQNWDRAVNAPPLELDEYNRFLPFVAAVSHAVRPCSW